MNSPTVTAVSDNARYDSGWYYCWLIERRDGPQPRWLGEYTWVTDANDAIWYARKSDAEAVCDHDLKGVGKVVVCEHGFAIEARSALADVGECEACKGQRTVQGPAVPGLFNLLGPHYQSLPCPSCTGKQPRPAAEVSVPDWSTFRPAAHTAQDNTSKLIDALEEGIALMGQEARDTFKSAQRNKDEPSDYDQYMDTYEEWIRDIELVSKHIATLRRLASTAERE